MLNMLIIDNNMKYIKILISNILKYNEYIRLLDIALDGEEALNVISNNKVDIILMDLKIPKINGVELIKKVSEEHLVENHSIIVLTEEINLIKSIYNNSLVYCCKLKSEKGKDVLKEISYIANKKRDKYIKDKIQKELKFLGYNMTHCGTKYLLECIKIDYIKYFGEAENLNKEIYPIISKKYKKSIFAIKNNILKATEYMYSECKEKKLRQYFDYEIDFKPTPKMILKTIIKKI